jgi:hypothetical protein
LPSHHFGNLEIASSLAPRCLETKRWKHYAALKAA